jgi:hypothetical protein
MSKMSYLGLDGAFWLKWRRSRTAAIVGAAPSISFNG